MSTRTRTFRVNFGTAAAALSASSVYYTVVGDDGTTLVSRRNTGVTAILEGPTTAAAGRFQVSVASFDDDWAGEIRWDDNGTGPRSTAASFDKYLAASAGGVPLSTAERQNSLRRIHSAAGAVRLVSATGNDGNDGLTWDTAYATLPAAVTAASSGDLILMGAGTGFALSAPLKTTKSLTIRGAGMDQTVLAGSAVNYICLGGTSVFEGISTSAQIAYKVANGDTPWSRLTVRRCRLTSFFDAYYPVGDGGGAVADLIDCEMQAAECVITVGATNQLTRVTRCKLYGSQSCLHAGGTIEAYDCELIAQAGSDATWQPIVTATGGVIRCFGGSIVTSNGTVPPTLQIANAAGTVELYNFPYDPAKTSGTITVRSSAVIRQVDPVIRDILVSQS